MGWALPFVRIFLLYVRKADIEVPNHWLNVSFIRWLACYPLSSFDSIYFGWRSLRYHLNTGMRNTAIKLELYLCTLCCSFVHQTLCWRRLSPQWNWKISTMDGVICVENEWWMRIFHSINDRWNGFVSVEASQGLFVL